jgi:TolB-like protein
MNPKKFFSELKRRKVYGVAISYAISGWLLAQIADLVTNNFEAPPWVMKMIIIALIIGLPIAVILAWVYDMTPQGIIKTKPKELDNDKITNNKNANIWNLIIGVLIIIVTLIIGGWWVLNVYKSSGKTHIKSLAILPVRNLTGDDDKDYIADGFHSNLITTCSKISSLRTIPPRSTLQYKNSNKSVHEIADELQVDAIVEASIMEFGDTIELNIQLTKAFPKEQNIWAQIFKQPTSDIYTLYNEVSKRIAKKIDLTLTPYEKSILSRAKKVNPDAYNAYLKGMSYWAKLTDKDLDKALKYFELAMEIDSSYAAAYSGIGLVWVGRLQQGILPSTNVIPKLDSLMSKALELDNSLSEVYYCMATYNTFVKWDWQKGGDAFEKAIETNKNYPAVRAFYSHYLYIIGKPKEALFQIKKALVLDPFNPLFQAMYGMGLNYSRKFTEAIDLLNNTLKTAPYDLTALSTLRSAYHNNKEFDKAYETFVRSYEVKNDKEAVLALKKGYAGGGYPKALNSLAGLLIDRSSHQYVTPWIIGTLFTRSGNNNEAIRYLTKAFNIHDSNCPYLNIDPIFDDLKNYPEFRNLITKMNFPNSD